MVTKKSKVPVSERALVARINRAIKPNDESLRRCREDSPSIHSLGRYYVVDLGMNAVVSHDVDLEAFGRELEVLAEHEELVDD